MNFCGRKREFLQTYGYSATIPSFGGVNMLETYEVLDNGEIKISDHVISVIATVAALSVGGVSRMSGTLTEDLQTKLRLKTEDGKGVKVSLKDNRLEICLYIFVDYGYPLMEVAEDVQRAVSESIKSMTDMEIGSVDVSIEGVTINKELKSVPKASR